MYLCNSKEKAENKNIKVKRKKFENWIVFETVNTLLFNVILCDHMGYDFHGSKVKSNRTVQMQDHQGKKEIYIRRCVCL
ncbi:unnamed protein product [Rhizophagus irregularis]|nr:unnamed protein product [Rhizophagus irregularis]